MAPISHADARSRQSVIENARRVIDRELEAAAFAISDIRSMRNALSFIVTLPEEVLAHIFFFLTLSNPFFYPSQTTSWLAVTYVCRSWRTAALAHPRLWSEIYIGPRPEWARLFLERAKAVPLSF
ncbi:hypothetical protein K488DRAFT_43582, partial [Vararia minispora EC-137]